MLTKTFSRYFKSYSVLKPYVDVKSRLDKIGNLKSNVRRRKLTVEIDEVVTVANKLEQLAGLKLQLEISREDIKRRLILMGDEDSDEKRKLKILAKIVRDDYKQCKVSVSDLDNNLIGLMMKVPNDLHSRTGDEDEVIHECKTDCKTTSSHLDIGSSLDLLTFRSPWECFLRGEAAGFELSSILNLTKMLKTDRFLGFSNPDFSREMVIDGCEGLNFRCLSLAKFENDQDLTFITGGASLLPFLSYFAKSVIPDKDLPLKCFSTGRSYSYDNPKYGLYDVPQTNACQVFALSSPSNQDELLSKITSTLTKFYESHNINFRVVVKGASQLLASESLRISFELFSPHFGRFFECGHLSLYGSLPSKTMNIHCSSNDFTDSFPSVISGTVFRVTPLIACLLETNKSL